jgi:hypothetical protein
MGGTDQGPIQALAGVVDDVGDGKENCQLSNKWVCWQLRAAFGLLGVDAAAGLTCWRGMSRVKSALTGQS